MRSLFAVILFALIGVGSTAKEKSYKTNWQPIPEIKVSGAKAFYDANGFTKIDDNTRAGMFMITLDEPQKFTINGKTVVAGTIVKSMIIKCDSGLTAPVMDLYFSKGLPTPNTVPIGGVEYFGNPKDIQQMSEKSIMYQILCGTEV
jgi:hypothetical protein